MLTAWVPQEALRELAARFTAITYPGEALRASGRVVEIGVDGLAHRCRVEVALENDGGDLGSARCTASD